MLRSIPMIGANDELFTNVPFSRRSVAGWKRVKPRLQSSRLEGQCRGRAGRQRLVELVDSVAEVLVVADEMRPGDVELQPSSCCAPLRT